jgi:hypothetical protein
VKERSVVLICNNSAMPIKTANKVSNFETEYLYQLVSSN